MTLDIYLVGGVVAGVIRFQATLLCRGCFLSTID
jgi:hypothetical protein